MFKRVVFFGLCLVLMVACAPSARSPLVIEEHQLSGPPDISTDQLVFHFASGDQAGTLAKTASYRDFRAQWKDYNVRALEPFGFQLKFRPQSAGGTQFETVDIYKGDQPIAREAVTLHPVSFSASRTRFIGLVELSDGSYTLTPGGLQARPAPFEKQPYGYVGDKLLSVEVVGVSSGHSRLNAYLGDQTAYTTDFNDVSVYGPLDGPYTYGGHWALMLIDAKPDGQGGWLPYTRLIQDGQDVTQAKEYDQAFQFALLHDRPFYFYQVGGKIGISFDGSEMPQGYDEIPHYQCCSGALLNPGTSMSMVWFFARRGSEWYYVEAYIPGALPQ